MSSRQRKIFLLLSAMALAVAGCSSRLPSSQARTTSGAKVGQVDKANVAKRARTGQASARYRYWFPNLGTMVATSSVAVEATVVDVQPGRTDGEALKFAVATLRLDKVLFGSPTGTTITLEQIVEDAGKPLVIDGVRHAQVGDHGIYFLRLEPGRTSSVYTLLNNQAEYVVSSDGTLVGSDTRDALVQQLGGFSLDQLRANILDAVARVSKGEFQAES